MKLKEFGPHEGGGRPKFYYVDPPLEKTLPHILDCGRRNTMLHKIIKNNFHLALLYKITVIIVYITAEAPM